MPDGVTKAIWHAVYCRQHQTLLCHVFLESGAHWSGLPLHAISTTNDFSIPREHLMPWTAMGEHIETFQVKYLEGLECEVFKPFSMEGRHTGIIIDWEDGYSRYPAEHKPLNLIESKSGQFALLPNNFVLFKDKHFTEDSQKNLLKFYRRGEEVYWEK
jgi:hypothetical protein